MSDLVKQYEFQSLKKTHKNSAYISSVSPSFNNVTLETRIAGLKCLQVDGRENNWLNYDTTGKKATYNRVEKPQIITITYSLENDNAFEIQAKVDKIKAILFSDEEPVEIRFMDEPRYYRLGIVSAFKFNDTTSLNFTFSFDIMCDLYKYGEDIMVRGNDDLSYGDAQCVVNYNFNNGYVLPRSIAFTTTNSDDLAIVVMYKGELKNLYFKGLAIGTNVFLDFDNFRVYENGSEFYEHIKLDQFDFNEFYIYDGAVINYHGCNNFELTFSERSL